MLPMTGSVVWHPCQVIAYQNGLYTVQFPSGDIEVRTRLQICFEAEGNNIKKAKKQKILTKHKKLSLPIGYR